MSIDQVIECLRQSGHKVTPQRVSIIKTVMESLELLTPSALYEKVRHENPDVGEVTVYRTLNILDELGLVCVVHTGENTHSYIGCPSEHHDHLICSDCGKVVNFTGCNFPHLDHLIYPRTNYSSKSSYLNKKGTCNHKSNFQ